MTLQTHIEKPADSSGRRNGDEFFTAAEYAAIDRHRSPMLREQLRSYTRGLTVAFIVLVAALGYVLWDNERRSNDQRHRDQQAQTERRADGIAARKQIVNTGNAVALEGCNRDFRTIVKLRAILQSGDAEVKSEVARGDIPAERGKRAHAFYVKQLAGLPLPDCRKVEHVVTDNVARLVITPTPLHP